MATAEFDSKFQLQIKEALYNALEYVNYSKEIETIFILISFECGDYYQIFFKINDIISMQHQLNENSKSNFDVSSENQQRLNLNGNKIATQMHKLFIADERESPTHIKIIYEPQKGSLKCTMTYEKLNDHANFIGDVALLNGWYKQMGGVLEDWEKYMIPNF